MVEGRYERLLAVTHVRRTRDGWVLTDDTRTWADPELATIVGPPRPLRSQARWLEEIDQLSPGLVT